MLCSVRQSAGTSDSSKLGQCLQCLVIALYGTTRSLRSVSKRFLFNGKMKPRRHFRIHNVVTDARVRYKNVIIKLRKIEITRKSRHITEGHPCVKGTFTNSHLAWRVCAESRPIRPFWGINLITASTVHSQRNETSSSPDPVLSPTRIVFHGSVT